MFYLITGRLLLHQIAGASQKEAIETAVKDLLSGECPGMLVPFLENKNVTIDWDLEEQEIGFGVSGKIERDFCYCTDKYLLQFMKRMYFASHKKEKRMKWLKIYNKARANMKERFQFRNKDIQ